MVVNHEIIIENLQPDDTIHYPIIIIKGHIENKPQSSCQTDGVLVKLFNCDFKLVGGKFKALAELKPGQNFIVFKYCCLQFKFSINYVERQTKYSVLPLYIICEGHDGRFQAPEDQCNDVISACKRISLCSKLLQSVFAEKLYEEKQGRKTFKLKDDCMIFNSKLNYLEARKLSQEELWSTLAREIIYSEIGNEETKFLAFLSCTKYCGEKYEENFLHQDIVKLTQAYVALGGGGLALFGTACLYTWPEDLSNVIKNFENGAVIDRIKFMDDSCYRGTFGTCFSTTLGSVLHELCHTFDLGHTENGIMGRGFDDIFKIFLSQEILKNEDICKTFQNSIEFEEKFDSRLPSEKLVEKKKNFIMKLGSTKDEDNTFWTKSCVIFLSYHRWFNNFESLGSTVIKFDPLSKFLTSRSGLRVIELRNEENGMVLNSWTFEGKILKFSFQIPEEELNKFQIAVILVVEDNIGNILRVTVNN